MDMNNGVKLFGCKEARQFAKRGLRLQELAEKYATTSDAIIKRLDELFINSPDELERIKVQIGYVNLEALNRELAYKHAELDAAEIEYQRYVNGKFAINQRIRELYDHLKELEREFNVSKATLDSLVSKRARFEIERIKAFIKCKRLKAEISKIESEIKDAEN